MKTNTNLNKIEVFPWNENFETGISKIDEQHRILVGLLNKLATTLINEDEMEVNSAFDELANYANLHFAEEEGIWVEYFLGDPWLSSHQMSHASFLPTVVDIKNNASGRALSDIIEQIVNFLIRWLAFHIIDEDKRMVIAVKALESGASMDEAKLMADKKMGGSMRTLIETILQMYDGLSSRALSLMRERNARLKAEKKLIQSSKETEKALEEITNLSIQLQTEVARRNQVLDRLNNQSNYDYLTNIPNHELIKDEASRLTSSEKEGSTLVGLMFIHLNEIEHINLKYGIGVGNNVLVEASLMIQNAVRDGDKVGRSVGADFIALLPNSESLSQIEQIAQQVIDKLNNPLESDISETLSACIGISIYPEHSESIDELVSHAYHAMHEATKAGKNKFIMSHS